jgi:uncharacterized protein (TIGR03435 family)
MRVKRRLHAVPIVLVAFSTMAPTSIWSQTDRAGSKDIASPAPAYEIISIKQNASGSSDGGWYRLPDGIRATNMPLQFVFYSAYNIVLDNQVTGLPFWADSDLYDIEAKVDAETAETWKELSEKARWEQQKLMLQSLLADRCQLKVHREMRELPVYDLVIAKGGRKMKEATPEERNAETEWSGRIGKIKARATPVEGIADMLSRRVGRLIVDKTGLGEKKFDFELTWTPDEHRVADATADSGPDLVTALEEQLGLKLVPSRGPVEVIVIDHIEKPSPN